MVRRGGRRVDYRLMLRFFCRLSDGTFTHDPAAEHIRAALANPDARFWLDMETPTDAEIDLLFEVFNFHPLAIEDSVTYTQRPKIELYPAVDGLPCGRYFYLVFHGPDLETFREHLSTKEIDMFVSDRYLVSVHHEPMLTVSHMDERMIDSNGSPLAEGIDVILYRLLDFLIDGYDTILDFVQEDMDDLEERAVSDPQPKVLTEIAQKKRELLNLRRIVGPQREVLAQLTRGDVPFIKDTTRIYLRDVHDHLIRVVEMLELYRDLILGSRDIYLSSVSNHLNQVMKTLTIISVIGVPLTIVTGFFGMNFDEPWMRDHRAFNAAILFMSIVVAGMLYLFWKKRWI